MGKLFVAGYSKDQILEFQSVEIFNFKNIKEARIDFSYPMQLLVGTNNAGKTSLIQGILLGYQGLQKLFEEGRIPFNDLGLFEHKKSNEKIEGVRIDRIPFTIDSNKEFFKRNAYSI
ncbi:MAG: AAA family ATPase [Bacillota bacterium]